MSTISPAAPPAALLATNPLRWLTVFGPGAIIASLTIGAGELIFSSRAGALFGFHILWFFLLVLAFKWVLMFTIARQIVLTGQHPFGMWMRLPGPRGWLPGTMFILAVICFPIWVCFHAGTLGTLAAWLTGTSGAFQGSAHFVWGAALLAAVMILSLLGGYKALEKAQLVVLLLMLASVVGVVFMMRPEWFEVLRGLLIPKFLTYPDWVRSHAEFAGRPVWLECVTYVGVLGGGSYDYLAYASYLRDKSWGMSAVQNSVLKTPPNGFDRRWLRAPLVDGLMSFAAVCFFTLVFVICGKMILGPAERIPSGTNLLNFQAEFVMPLLPALRHLYFLGAFLTIFGTLYGTLEVGPAILREMTHAWRGAVPENADRSVELRHRRAAILWAGLGGLGILAVSLMYALSRPGQSPPALVTILTPANLFTGVLGCGIICLLSLWTNRRFLEKPWRMPPWLAFANGVAGLTFFGLGLYAYWQHSRWLAFVMLAATVGIGGCAAAMLSSRDSVRRPD